MDNVDICLIKGAAALSGQIDSPFLKGSAAQLHTISKSLLQRSGHPVRENRISFMRELADLDGLIYPSSEWQLP